MKLELQNEYLKDNIKFNQSIYQEMRRIAITERSHIYTNNHKINIITANYPDIKLAIIDIDDNFCIKSINTGKIKYENLMAYFPDKILNLGTDYRTGGFKFNIFPQDRKTKTFIYPNIGEIVITGRYNLHSIIIKSMDFYPSHAIENFNDTYLITIIDIIWN